MKMAKMVYKNISFIPPSPYAMLETRIKSPFFLKVLQVFTQHCCGGGGRLKIFDHDCRWQTVPLVTRLKPHTSANTTKNEWKR